MKVKHLFLATNDLNSGGYLIYYLGANKWLVSKIKTSQTHILGIIYNSFLVSTWNALPSHKLSWLLFWWWWQWVKWELERKEAVVGDSRWWWQWWNIPPPVNTTEAFRERKPLSLTFILHEKPSQPTGGKIFINLSIQHNISNGAGEDGESVLPPEHLHTLAPKRCPFPAPAQGQVKTLVDGSVC